MSGIRNSVTKYCFGHVLYTNWSTVLYWLCSFVQVVKGCQRLAFLPKASLKLLNCCISRHQSLQKFSIAAAAHITDGTQLCKDWVKSPFIINGTIPLDCCLPPVLSAQPAWARVVSLHRDEPFQGHDKGPAFGRILFYCGWKLVQWLAEDLRIPRWPSAGWCSTATPSVVTLMPIALSV